MTMHGQWSYHKLTYEMEIVLRNILATRDRASPSGHQNDYLVDCAFGVFLAWQQLTRNIEGEKRQVDAQRLRALITTARLP